MQPLFKNLYRNSSRKSTPKRIRLEIQEPQSEQKSALQCGLVVLDGEEGMGVAFEEVGCEGALGQQRIGGEGLAADVFELVEERNDGADLVGALRLVVGAELQADFFWV